MGIPIKKTPKTRIMYARGITVSNYNFLRAMTKKKGYKTISNLLNVIIDTVRAEEGKE